MSELVAAGMLAVFGGVGLAAGARLELAAVRRRLAAAHQAATHDTVTGLLHRAGLVEAWPRLAGRAIVVLDLDGFKPVNDHHGHAAGDRMLATIAGRLSQRTSGVVARLGGDEFAAVLVTADPVEDARRLASAVAEPVTLPGGVSVVVTASVGVTASWAGDLAGALAAADAAMYRAKTTGTTVAVYDPARDNRPGLGGGPRPAVRVRDLDTGREHPGATERLPQPAGAAGPGLPGLAGSVGGERR